MALYPVSPPHVFVASPHPPTFLSLSPFLKVVDHDTAWAWFSHCAGVSVFMLIVTQQIRWIFVFPVLGGIVLWGMTMAVPEPWMEVSAHSVGYGLLGVAALVALFAFGHVVYAWQQLVGYVGSTYPQLRNRLQKDVPFLEGIVRDYAGALSPTWARAQQSQCEAVKMWRGEHRQSGTPNAGPGAAGTALEEADVPLTSLLPTTRLGGCFFCRSAPAVHLLPCCSLWGAHAQWRVSLAKDIKAGGSAAAAVTPVPNCSPYCDVQLRHKRCEAQLQEAKAQLERGRAEAAAAVQELQVVKAELLLQQARAQRELQEHHVRLQDLDKQWTCRTDTLLTQSNRTLHEQAEQLKTVQRQLQAAKRELGQQREVP